MISLDDAYKKALKEFKEIKIHAIYESDSNYFFRKESEGRPIYGGRYFALVSKEKGEFHWIDPNFYFDEIDNSKDVEIPKTV